MLSKERLEAIKVGDQIQFSSPSRFGEKIVWRFVNGWVDGNPTVKFRGVDEYIIMSKEILDIKS